MCKLLTPKRTRRTSTFSSYQNLVELLEGDRLIAFWRTFNAEGARLSNWPRVKGQVVQNSLIWIDVSQKRGSAGTGRQH